MMNDDLSVPKEQFLVDFFKSRKNPGPPEGKPFSEVMNTIQVRIEKRSLAELQAAGGSAEESIDSLDPKQAISLLKETIDTLRSISG